MNVAILYGGCRTRTGEAARRKAQQYGLDRITPISLADLSSLLEQAAGFTPATTLCADH